MIGYASVQGRYSLLYVYIFTPTYKCFTFLESSSSVVLSAVWSHVWAELHTQYHNDHPSLRRIASQPTSRSNLGHDRPKAAFLRRNCYLHPSQPSRLLFRQLDHVCGRPIFYRHRMWFYLQYAVLSPLRVLPGGVARVDCWVPLVALAGVSIRPRGLANTGLAIHPTLYRTIWRPISCPLVVSKQYTYLVARTNTCTWL